MLFDFILLINERHGYCMIRMSQVKVPVQSLLKVSSEEYMKHGIISEEEEALVIKAAAKMLRIPESGIRDFVIQRKSLDARKKDSINYIYQVKFNCNNEKKIVKRYGKNDASVMEDTGHNLNVSLKGMTDSDKKRIVIAGMGPAGLFAALTLAKAGVCPVVIERGSDVIKRQRIVENFWSKGELNPECNVQFGEGGAGTFSDGKLNTLVKDTGGYNYRVLSTFVEYGAPSEILYLQKPHIGTDRLRDIVKAIREDIIRLGGEVYFDTRLTDIIYEEGYIQGIKVSYNDCRHKTCDNIIKCSHVILATGHSARDTFYKLMESGVYMEPKPFAVGVRVEHPQEMIGRNQYGEFYTKLPVADYKLTYTTKAGRGVYSFCMCPGGYVVNASSEKGRLAVNGMSNYERDGRNANSAIVVTVSPEDFGSTGMLAGVEFQRKWEEAAYRQAGGAIPVQLLADFVNNIKSTGFGEIVPEMKGDYAFANVREVLPEIVGDSIAEGMMAFDRRIKGFGRDDTVLSGIESRTSSPVRIRRDDSLQANIRGLYPCGEGAGYAGGITSAAMDGIRVAEQILSEK